MTIQDIARMAEVSPAAVSRYQHGGPLSEEKRERIRQVIEKTGYRPSATGRELRTGRIGQIGVIVPSINSGAVSEITSGISEVLSDTEYLIVLGNGENDTDKELEHFYSLQNGRASGIILMGTAYTEKHREAFRDCRLPFVVTGQRFEGVNCVYYDNRTAAAEITTRLIAEGADRIAFIGVHAKDPAVGIDRLQGVKDALEKSGRDPEKLLTYTGSFTYKTGEEGVEDILSRDRGIDTVICATDMIALGAMKHIKEMGLRIPQEVRVAGFGDNWAGQVIQPALTTVRFDNAACGRYAAETVLDLIEGRREKNEVRQMQIDYEIIERAST